MLGEASTAQSEEFITILGRLWQAAKQCSQDAH